jgi:prepilin-type N-terminal cleavage/methylation domain-containing protein
MHQNRFNAFTLAELLIALAILGVIATFTIPKVLQAQQDSKNKAIAKEAAGMISDAYQRLRLQGKRPSQFGIADMTPYFNYIAVTSTATVDIYPTGGAGGIACNGNYACLKLANGAILLYGANQKYCSDTMTNNALFLHIDPDGVYKNDQNGLGLWLYTNGKLRTWATIENPTMYNTDNTCGVAEVPDSNRDPSWFSWN